MKKHGQSLYLSIGEFSQLTGVSKEKLRFYDAENIFSPAVIAENGYRYYLLEQMFSIFLVIILSRSNLYSLSQIREIINNPSISFNNLLTDWESHSTKQLENMQIELNNIKSQIRRLEFFSKFENDKPYIIDYYYSSLYVTPINPNLYPFDEKAIKQLSNHTADVIRLQKTSYTFLAMLLENESFTSGDYKICGYYSPLYSFPSDERITQSSQLKTLYYQFNAKLSDTKNKLDYLNRYIIDNNFKCIEKVYITVIADDFENPSNCKCKIQVFIPIEENATTRNLTFTPAKNNVFDSTKTIEYTSGEFANLCQITKETLRFYNKKQLLTAKITSENGYKKYTNEQLGHFYFIKMLQKSGCTIKEIRNLFFDKSISKYDILSNCKNELEVRIKRYTHYKNMTHALYDIRKQFINSTPKDVITVQNFYDLPHIHVYSKKKFEMFSEDCLDVYKTMTDKYFIQPKTIHIPIVMIMESEDFENSSFLLSSYAFLNFDSYRNVDELPIRKYLFLRKKLSYDKIYDEIPQLREYASKSNMKSNGQIRIVITIDTVKSTFENIFSVYYFVPVE